MTQCQTWNSCSSKKLSKRKVQRPRRRRRNENDDSDAPPRKEYECIAALKYKKFTKQRKKKRF